MGNITYRFKDFLAEGVDGVLNENLAKDVDYAIKRVNKEGGNPENLIGAGLRELASHLDAYSEKKRPGHPGEGPIYTSATVQAFKTFVEMMANDEIENNQPDY